MRGKKSKKSKIKFNRRILFVSGFSMFGAAVLFACIFYWLYFASKQTILQKWKNDAVQSAQKVGYYMKMPIDAVSFSAVTINDMMKQGATHEEVSRYLINETAIYASAISENSTGVYSFYKGIYLDGSGWIPPEDYKPKERPWYTAAVLGKGSTVLVKPFLNLQTFTMMMSVSKLLDDGESVVSMDIFLDSVQEMTEKTVSENHAEKSIVMDKSGFVVAHSNKKIIGKNLNEDGSDLEKKIVAMLNSSDEKQFSLKRGGNRYTIFCEPINSDWQTVLVLKNSSIYRSLASIYVFSGAAIFIVMSAILLVFIRISRKYEEAEQLSREIAAVANIYVTVVKIDLKSDTMVCVRGNPDIDALLSGDYTNFSKRSVQFAEKMSAARSKDLMKKFMETETLAERLKDSNSISQEFLDDKERWIRLRFIVIDRDSENRPLHLLMVFESIDEDKKQQEKLKHLSEIDIMTGIRNRGCGETLVRKATEEGQRGMFCLMDADKFKSINDTFGHAAGDKVIIAIADCLKKTFRDSDIIFRLGGDEFAVFSEGVSSEDIGRRIIERLFKRISAVEIPELNGRKIELSVGVSFFPSCREDSFDKMYCRTDCGIYESKKQTGNSVSFR